MINHISNTLSCTGCGACMEICPQNAIKMNLDKRGFRIPIVNEEKCIKCGKCLSICPKDKKMCFPESTVSLAAISNNKKIYKYSASGGVFSTIALAFLKQTNRYVCGSAFINGEIKHILTNNKEDIYNIAGSKYAQSSLCGIYSIIKEKLEIGCFVLFSGTPCQVDGLRHFLNKQYNNLYCIDLICHGVPSFEFFKRDMALYDNYWNISRVTFRKKNYIFKSRSGFLLEIKRKKGNKTILLPNRDPFYSMFISNLSFRECCYSCKYASLQRCGDITIGDFDSYRSYPNFRYGEAASVVLINSDKGSALWNLYKGLFDFTFIDVFEEAKINTQLLHPSPMPSDDVINSLNIDSLDFDFLRKKYCKKQDFKGRLAITKALLFPVRRK